MNGAITGLYAGLTGVLLLGLALRVVGLRRAHRVGIGDGGVAALQQAIRAHGNLVEYAPLALLLLLCAELSAALPVAALHAAGTVLVAARLLHAVGISRNPNRSAGRFYGTLLTWAVLLALAAALVFRGVRAAF